MATHRTARTVHAGIIGTTPYSPSPSLNPGLVKALDNYSEFEGYLAPALRAFDRGTQNLIAIEKARKQSEKNGVWNKWEKLLHLSTFATKKHAEILQSFDIASRDLKLAIEGIEQALTQPLESQSMGVMNQEIRTYVGKLTQEKRSQFLLDALKQKDMVVLSSVLGARPFLSGMVDHEYQRFTRLFREQENPELVGRLNATRKGLELVESNAPLVHRETELSMGMAEDAKTGSLWGLIADLKAGDKAAREALEIADEPGVAA